MTVGGRPLLPLVADHAGAAPMTRRARPTVDVAVATSKAHQPPAIVLAWDVTRTTYRSRTGAPSRLGPPSVAEAAADPLLRRDHPELYDGSWLLERLRPRTRRCPRARAAAAATSPGR